MTIDPTERIDLLARDLRTSLDGLSSREAGRRRLSHGPNQLERREGRNWPRELARQFTHPLALLLWGAAALAAIANIAPIAIAVVVVIALNAAFAFVQELQAERAVEALQDFLPPQAKVIRDGHRTQIDAASLVPGDLLVIEEGDRISADAHIVEGAIEVDLSTLTGESVPVSRSAAPGRPNSPLLQANELVFSGTSCTGGQARALVFATGMATELGRIAALSQRLDKEESPLERQVRRVAWLIAGIALLMGLAFLPLATLGAGLSLSDSIIFAIGLIVGNVPEGLLPVITLALAVGVRGLVHQGAVVKRLSAVETLGSTDVICTDKTGTLTENRMRVTRIWTAGEEIDLEHGPPRGGGSSSTLLELAGAMAACNNAHLDEHGEAIGDPTEAAMLLTGRVLGAGHDAGAGRRAEFHFDPVLKRMATVDASGGRLWVNVKGAPEAVLGVCEAVASPAGAQPLDADRVAEIEDMVGAYADEGLRVLAVARRPIAAVPPAREDAERRLTLLGLVALLDPPRPEVSGAVARCHEAGIRIVVITGDHPRTAVAVAKRIGISRGTPRAITGEELEEMSDAQLDAVLRNGDELVFARSTPEAKLRIADALRAERHVVAMTGDGVNDA
ncbi:MAG TPA: cation-transporting P-type ATPase, partial [Solirubrobacterales bacterium]|nr:cation-transporting P-type ATPase [Solirubrobacterales bacterium]